MGSSNSFNADISIKGDLNIYICGNINYNSGLMEDVFNYNVLTQIFDKFEGNGKIVSEKYGDKIYPYEYRKLDKEVENSEKKERKKYNAFLFFNKVNEMFSNILLEEHLYDMDKKNSNKNIIIYFGKDEYIKGSFDKLYNKSPGTLPFLIIVKNTHNYSEKLKIVNYIPNIYSIKKNLLMNETHNFYSDEIESLCEKALFSYLMTKIYRLDMYYNELGYNLNMINPFNEINSKIKVNLTIGLVGHSGCGKSTLINIFFEDLVSKVNSSATDVTTKCSEYYLPVNISTDNVGQIRFLDFPGIKEEKNYYDVVEPEIKRKIKEYKNNKEQIDLVLFYISNENGRILTETGLKLINLLHSNKIKILFIINGYIEPSLLEIKKISLKNEIKNNEIFKDNFSNIIHTNYYQKYGNKRSKTGIILIITKIIDFNIFHMKILVFNFNDINYLFNN